MKATFDAIGKMEFSPEDESFIKEKIEGDDHIQKLKDRHRLLPDEMPIVPCMWKVILNKNIKKDDLKLFRDYQNYLGEGFEQGYFERDLLNTRIDEAVEKLKD